MGSEMCIRDRYELPEQATTAMVTFNSALSEKYNVEAKLCHLTDWRSAICGIESCPMGLGSSCDYLHVFNNPGNEYPGRPHWPHRRANNGFPYIIDKDYNYNEVRGRRRSRSRSPIHRRGNACNTIRRRGDKPKQPCIYYNKTGACIFGAACQLRHRSNGETPSILVPNFFEYVFELSLIHI